MSADYGALGPLVAGVGSVVAATATIIATWTGNARWAPPISALPNAPKRVAALVVIAGIVWLWAQDKSTLSQTATISGIAAVVSLFVYIFLTIVCVHKIVVSDADGEPKNDRVVGGFFLKSVAREKLAEAGDIEILLQGSQYNPNLLWPRWSIGLATVVIVAAYMTLVVAGSLSVASGALYFR